MINAPGHSPRRRDRPSARIGLFFACIAALSATARVAFAQSTCVGQGQTAIFVAFSENAPDAVFKSDDGCLAGGGRGVGCCPGSVCRDCQDQINVVEVQGATVELAYFSCECDACAVGTVQPLEAQTSCVPCPAGWFQDVTGQSACKPCPVGTFSTAIGNSIGCTSCGEGTSGTSSLEEYYAATTRTFRAPATGDGSVFDATLAATRCTPCPAGTYGGGAGEACRPCAAGYWSNKQARTCSPCPVGTYSTTTGGAGIASCLACQAGESNDAEGSTSCYQVCPIPNLSCPESAKRARGVYEAEEAALSVGRTVGVVGDDEILNYRTELCKVGCTKFREAFCLKECLLEHNTDQCANDAWKTLATFTCESSAHSFDHWCSTFGDPNADACDAYTPPPPPATPPPPPSPPPVAADAASATPRASAPVRRRAT